MVYQKDASRSQTAAVSVGWQSEAMAAEEFKNKDLKGSRFTHVDLSESRFHDLAMRDVRITGAWIQDLVIEAEIEGSLLVNGIDVLPHVEEALNAKHPGRETVFAVRDGDADSFRAAWAIDERVWEETVERARRLPEESSTSGSTASGRSSRRCATSCSPPTRGSGGRCRGPVALRPARSPVLRDGRDPGRPERHRRAPVARRGARAPCRPHGQRERGPRRPDRRAARGDDRGGGADGYPESESFPVRRCLGAIVIEEWEHHLFANRDLAVLEPPGRDPTASGRLPYRVRPGRRRRR